MSEPQAPSRVLPIPARLNLVVLAVAATISVASLVYASHANRWWGVVLAALVFSFSNNTLFALLHEAVHGVLHPSPRVNRWLGRVLAAFFPTGYAVQRAFHLTHHRNNRSRYEQFDYLHEGDVRWLKVAQWYAILTGLYWGITVIGVALYAMLPQVLRLRLLRATGSRVSAQTSSGPYLDALDDLPPLPTRLELLGSLLFQAVLFLTLDLSWTGWLACYAAFAIHWSSLQYADHAFSPLDPIHGAWNLRVNRLTRAIFLNYHYHLAHHQHPQVSWVHLGRLVDHTKEQPRFLAVWWSMWRGPRPFPGDVQG